MSNYDLIEEINNIIDGLWLDKIEGTPIVGEIRSNAHLHPIQYRALTNTVAGMDDPFEGVGWTPSEAMRNLKKILVEAKNNPYDEESEEE